MTRKSHSVSHGPGPGAARTNVQKRRRKSHGLTIKIESPTTGEDSSAGIIDTGSGLDFECKVRHRHAVLVVEMLTVVMTEVEDVC